MSRSRVNCLRALTLCARLRANKLTWLCLCRAEMAKGTALQQQFRAIECIAATNMAAFKV